MSDVFVYTHKHARLGRSGGMHVPPENFLKLEIASEATLGQKQSRSGYMAREVLHPIFGCARMHLLASWL